MPENNSDSVSVDYTSKSRSIFRMLGESICDHPFLYVSGILVCFLLLSTQLTKIYFDTSTEGFLNPEHPSIQHYNLFREEFGHDELLIIAVRANHILGKKFITTINKLYKDLSLNLPYTESVDSLFNARYIYGKDDELIVEDLFENWKPGEGAPAETEKIIEESELYKGLYLSENYNLTTIITRIDYSSSVAPDQAHDEKKPDEKLSELLAATHDIVNQYKKQGVEIYVGGSPAITEFLKKATLKDMVFYINLTLIVISIVLFVLFRRVSGVILPLLTVVISVISTLSIMIALNQPIQLLTAIIPSFLLAVGVADSIHFLTCFYINLEKTGNKRSAIIASIEYCGPPMLLTSLTTTIGLMSFATADMLPVANLGIYSSLGILLAFGLSITMLPAMVSILPIKPKTNGKNHSNKVMETVILFAAHISYQYPKTILSLTIIIVSTGTWFASQLVFSHNPLLWLPDQSPLRGAVETIDGKLGGSVSVEITLDTGEEFGIYDPGFMKKLDGFCKHIGNYKSPEFKVNKVVSIVDILKETNRALHSNDQAYYRIPDNRELIAQELFMLELSGAKDLFRLTNRNYETARVTISIPWIDALLYKPFMEEVNKKLKMTFSPDIETTVTGLVPLLGSTLSSVMRTTAQSYIIAIMAITVAMIIFLKSLKFGLLSIIPNLSPILIVMGIMKINDVPLDMFTMLIGSIAIGLCVDDTIHFMHHFRKNYDRGNDVKKSIELTLTTAGRALLSTSIVLFCGFFVMATSDLKNAINFGVYTGLAIILALLADFLVAPALMTLFFRNKRKKH